MFLVMIIIQGLFTGLIAGQISSDSVAAGVKHSFVMLVLGVTIFLVLLKSGFV